MIYVKVITLFFYRSGPRGIVGCEAAVFKSVMVDEYYGLTRKSSKKGI